MGCCVSSYGHQLSDDLLNQIFDYLPIEVHVSCGVVSTPIHLLSKRYSTYIKTGTKEIVIDLRGMVKSLDRIIKWSLNHLHNKYLMIKADDVYGLQKSTWDTVLRNIGRDYWRWYSPSSYDLSRRVEMFLFHGISRIDTTVGLPKSIEIDTIPDGQVATNGNLMGFTLEKCDYKTGDSEECGIATYHDIQCCTCTTHTNEVRCQGHYQVLDWTRCDVCDARIHQKCAMERIMHCDTCLPSGSNQFDYDDGTIAILCDPCNDRIKTCHRCDHCLCKVESTKCAKCGNDCCSDSCITLTVCGHQQICLDCGELYNYERFTVECTHCWKVRYCWDCAGKPTSDWVCNDCKNAPV